MEPSVTITIKSITTDSIFRIKGHDREDSAEKITLPNKYVPILQPTTYELAKFSVAKNSSYSTLYASNEISCTEATKNINKTIMIDMVILRLLVAFVSMFNNDISKNNN